MTRTLTRLYDDADDAYAAVRDLKKAGISDTDISIFANDGTLESTRATEAGADAATGAEVGGVVGAGAGLLAGLGLLAIPGVGPIVAAGWLAATAAGAAAGAVAGGATGGLIGALTGEGVSEDDANVYAESVRRGGSLVTVRVSDAREIEADRILNSHSPADLGARGRDYRANGWQRFEPGDYVPPSVAPGMLPPDRPTRL